ncbi:MAG: restriction endonuclease [Cyanobacteriota bacterium]|nr:restriction endonuclease [Cyanobacteriota bacterium]
MLIIAEKIKYLELIEYQPRRFEVDEINYNIGKILWQTYESKIALEFPSPKTEGKWQLTSKGWVGHLLLTPQFQIVLKPKVPLANIFGMLEYAYNLKSFRLLSGLINCQSLQEFYSQLAYILAQKVLERSRKGFYWSYLPQTNNLPYVRGRMDIRQAIQKPWEVKVKCYYQERRADNIENQIILWTLWAIARSNLCSETVLPAVRKAFRVLEGLVNLKSVRSQDCLGREYNRLNEDYRVLHALCRFFLDNSGASYEKGDRLMLPFLVEMDKLYESFVAEWLKINAPPGFIVKSQYKVSLGQKRYLKIDLLLRARGKSVPRCILDTKYKIPDKAAMTDIHEMVSHANAVKCLDAILIYPKPLKEPLDIQSNNIRVRSLTFSLDGNLELAGKTFLKELFKLA